MSTYLIPKNSVDDTVVKQLSAARIDLVSVGNLRSFILADDPAKVLVLAVDADTLMLITRHKSHVLETLPSVVMNMPGVVYPPQWMVFGAQLPTVDWIEFSQMTAKSGSLVTDLGQETSVGESALEIDSPDDHFS